jgi:hypothetical protein
LTRREVRRDIETLVHVEMSDFGAIDVSRPLPSAMNDDKIAPVQ